MNEISPPSLPIMNYVVANEIISQRVRDGYINATALCKASGKFFGNYNQMKTTEEFLSALSSDIGIPISGLVQSIKGGPPHLQGTWIHPQVAIHFAQWLSPKFAVQVTKWVFDWMSGKVKNDNLPYHLKRYMANMPNVPRGYFSILNEATIALIGPLEQMGYTLPDNMIPDISMGRIFSKWLRDNGHNPEEMPTYKHSYGDGRVIDARAYPNSIWPDFQKHLVQEWMHHRAAKYFKPRDPKALPYLKNLLALPNYSDVAGYVEVAPTK
jgi:hypothetical protein